MVRIAGGLEIRGVTGVALRRHRLELAGRSSFMAGVAIHGRVRAGQRKAIIVLLHLPYGYLPPPNGMAPLAVCSQLALVDVGMAILTTLSNIGEYEPDVTSGAGYGRVHAAQGIFRLVVIEFRNGADRSPRICGVAVLASQVQIAVWTAHSSWTLGKGHAKSRDQRQKKPRNYLTDATSPHRLSPAVAVTKA